jgi:hypothetical protein
MPRSSGHPAHGSTETDHDAAGDIFGLLGPLAMQAYLATIGSGKVGVPAIGRDGAGVRYIA